MASLTIKRLPEPLLRRLRKSAKQHHRSLNSEVIDRLERAVGPSTVDPESFLAELKTLQERAPLPKLTDKRLDRAINRSHP